MTESAEGGGALPPAGWYPDPHQPGMMRYWDGSQWPLSVPPVESRRVAVDPNRRILVTYGLAFLLPPAGAVSAILLMARDRERDAAHGIFAICLAVMASVIWWQYLFVPSPS